MCCACAHAHVTWRRSAGYFFFQKCWQPFLLKAFFKQTEVNMAGHNPVIQKVDVSFRLKAKDDSVKPDPSSTNVLKMLGFSVSELIGQGEYSKIVRARWNDRRQGDVAIKIVPKFRAPPEYYQKMLPNELHALRKTQAHILIIDLYAVYESPRAYYMVLEYLPMGDLQEYVNKRKYLGEAESRKFFKQLLEAVDFLHTKNIVHRDIKLDNILLDKHFNIRLSDFGFATSCHVGQRLLSDCGSMLYAAPEVYQLKGYDGFKADVWSCGICLYGMLCGRLPFPIPDRDVFLGAVNTKLVFSRLLSKYCRRLIRSLLTVDPIHRPFVAEVRVSPWFSKPIDVHDAQEYDATEGSQTSLMSRKSCGSMANMNPSHEHGFACDHRKAQKAEVKAKFVSNVLRALAVHKSEQHSLEHLREDPLKVVGVVGQMGKQLSMEVPKFGYYGQRTSRQAYATGMVGMPADELFRQLIETRNRGIERELKLLKFSLAGRLASEALKKAVEAKKGPSALGKNLRFKAAVLRVQRERMDGWRLICKQMMACSATLKEKLIKEMEVEDAKARLMLPAPKQ